MSRPLNDKTCMVCGDRALGHNFNAVTCESCKAFFRRNAMSSKKFSCPFSNVCEITTITRRFCQKCRLEKCFKVGMKKEYIMSEEDKELKRIKIEQNRNKRKLKTDDHEKTSSGDDEEPTQSKKLIRVKEEWSPGSVTSTKSNATENQSESSINVDSDESRTLDKFPTITAESSATKLVEAITKVPKDSSQVIQELMKTQKDTLKVMTKIIQDSSQALTLISHLIKNPSDAMLIISKVVSSPLDALSVFTQFMASPTNALQIIFKIISSPKDVLSFITELTKAPQDALEIMSRFMSSPGESLTEINRMIMRTSSACNDDVQCKGHDEVIKSMLEVSSANSPTSSIASPTSSFQSMLVSESPQSVPSTVDVDYDGNNNDYQDNNMKLLNEISNDVRGKESPFNVNSIDSIINEAIKLEYETPQMVSQLQSPNRELSEVEIMKIQELIDSNKALYAPVDEDYSNLVFGDCRIKAEPGVDPTLLKVINLTAIAIRRLIKMSKKISGFKKMCQEDQIALLKGGCIEMMVLRSVMQYDLDHAFWKIPTAMNATNIGADILKLCPKGNVYEEHEKFIKTFDPKLRTDENLVLILCAITLFCPDRQNVVHNDVIKLEQNSYYFLLRRYLEYKYGGCEARSIFLQLLRKIQEVRKLNEDIISVYLDVNPSQVEPLLREIFDLKV